jgi:hypothetical protein
LDAFATSLAIRRPRFWQKQITIQQAMKISLGIAQMHSDDAVLGLAPELFSNLVDGR